jgi:hypothetical protein
VSDRIGELLELIDALDDVIRNAKPVPLTGQVRLDQDDVYAKLDRMRELVPEVIFSARAEGAAGAAPAREPGPEPAGEPAQRVDLEEAARTLKQLVERVKFGGERFRLEGHGMPMAELRPADE